MKETVQIPRALFDAMLAQIKATVIDLANDQRDAYHEGHQRSVARMLLKTEHADAVREAISEAISCAAWDCGMSTDEFEPATPFLEDTEVISCEK